MGLNVDKIELAEKKASKAYKELLNSTRALVNISYDLWEGIFKKIVAFREADAQFYKELYKKD